MHFSLSRPDSGQRKSSTTPHYQTFPTAPPRNKGRPPSDSESPYRSPHGHSRNGSQSSQDTPLPKRQLAVLAIIALCEQTALNSISPYLPTMTGTFPEVDQRQVGTYVGMIASSFALAQFATNFLWGWLSDRIGRKPVILTGTLSTAACFLAFGFCRTLWQAILVQTLMGLLNGNQGVVSTCLGEITDRSNQSQAFAYLPVVYGIGGITGPLLGGLLAGKGFGNYPFLAPNLLGACILVIDLIVIAMFMEETHEQARDLPPLGTRLRSLFAHVWQFTSSSQPTYLRRGRGTKDRSRGENASLLEDDDTSSISTSSSRGGFTALLPTNSAEFASKDVFNRNTILLLGTYFVFQLSNISYNSLYPIFAQGPGPTGRNLSTGEIGLSLAFAGLVTIAFQIGIFGKMREKLGNKATYRIGLGGFVTAFILMPFVGYKNEADAGTEANIVISTGKVALWIELGFVLLIKTVATVGGLTSALLLITNSAPTHAILGRLNGLAQTLSAAGRAVGPILSGGLFSLVSDIRPKGEAIAFGTFGGIAFLGFVFSFGITGNDLEAEGWNDDDDGDSNEEAVSDDASSDIESSAVQRRPENHSSPKRERGKASDSQER